MCSVSHPDAYLRQIPLRARLDERRRPWRREQSWALPPDRHQAGPESNLDRVAVLGYLAELPPRRRAVVVLRYFCDLTVEETAETLRISPGTVKSQTARALQAVRARLLEEPAGMDRE